MKPFLVALLLLLPLDGTKRDHCDLIERNHYHDCDGKPVFTQWLFYSWDEKQGEYRIEDWRLCKGQVSRDGSTFIFRDGELLRAVRADCYRESRTQIDPEVLQQATFPKASRRGLSK